MKVGDLRRVCSTHEYAGKGASKGSHVEVIKITAYALRDAQLHGKYKLSRVRS